MADRSSSSEFLDNEQAADITAITGIEEIYSSHSGYSRLLRCVRYGKRHLLKALKEGCCGQDFFEQALRKEFDLGYGLDNIHICHTLGWEDIEGIGHCILMEYVDGMTLEDYLSKGLLHRELAYKIIAELCDALQYLHRRQIVHRDLKPTNILITHNGCNVKLIDFGLSDSDDYDILKQPAGTRYYIAPEALVKGAPLDLRMDIFSLGVIIGEMAETIDDAPLAAVSRRCTRNKPEERYSSAEEVAAAVRRAFHHRRRVVVRILEWSAAAAVVVLVAFTIFSLYLLQDKSVAIPVASTSRGDIVLNEGCRRILSSTRIRHHASSTSTQNTIDSTQLMNELLQALDSDYPLEQQRHTTDYNAHIELLKQEVSKIVRGERE
jgi:serine/threonine protein kinase